MSRIDIIKNPWDELFMQCVLESRQKIKITTPFISCDSCKLLINNKQKTVSLDLITDLRITNAYHGSLSIDGLRYLLKNKCNIRSLTKLHAKIYLFDDKKAIVTSGNMTNNGLKYNYEYGIYIEDNNIIKQINNDYEAIFNLTNNTKVNIESLDVLQGIIEKYPKNNKLFEDDYYPDFIVTQEQLSTSLSGWVLEVFNCINNLPNKNFDLQDIYSYEKYLKNIYPNNNNIQAKIRQQLQILRNIGLLEFTDRGLYKCLWDNNQ